jgi:hypothetical protein
MKLVLRIGLCLLLGLASAAIAPALASQEAAGADFKPIFDGKTLEGWSAAKMSYWSVEDGAITAESTEANPCTSNQFLVWQGGDVADFELKLKFRLGENRGNSGIQFRSRLSPSSDGVGYQADILPSGGWLGGLCDENTGRETLLAPNGHKTVIDPDGKRTTTRLGEPVTLKKAGEWNDYHIVARGNHIVLKVNDRVSAEVIDNETGRFHLKGILGLQLRSGPPMKVQFKDIHLKRLNMSERKKIVFVAGPVSHDYGSHEHNAGCLLLAKCLNENMPGIFATVYTNGWPKDPTAFDNADAIVIFCDGNGGNVALPHFEQLDKLVKKGAGIAFIHYALTVPKGESGSYMLNWLGGYYETFWSVNPTWTAEFKQLPRHPITRGVRPFTINDEWYYHMRFVADMKNVTPILTATPPDSTRKGEDGPHSGNPQVRARMGMPEHMAWAFQPPGGGRGFGFTGAHWHWNWAHNDMRKLMLNALVWIAGADVPSDGVTSKTPSIEELEANIDEPKPENWKPEEIGRMIERFNK